MALKYRPNDARIHRNLGNALHGAEFPQEAMHHYRLAFQYKPDFAGAYNNLGLSLQAKGDLEAAIENYRKFLDLKRDQPTMHRILGLTLIATGQLDEGIVHLPCTGAPAGHGRGSGASEQGRGDRAHAAWRAMSVRAVSLWP